MVRQNLIIPICGEAKRFRQVGIYTPKPFIKVAGKRIIDWCLDSITLDNFNLIFIVPKDSELTSLSSLGQVIEVEGTTSGAVDTCLRAKHLVDSNVPLTIFTLDVFFKPKWNGIVDDHLDGLLLTFNSSSPNYSYCSVKDDLVDRVKEKSVISNHANAGIYWFKRGSDFVQYASEYVNALGSTWLEVETHVAPLYQSFIKYGYKIGIHPVDLIYIMGTPSEAKFIESVVVDNSLPVGVVSDHSGFNEKNRFKEILDDHGIEYIDFGCFSNQLSDYSDVVPNSCEAVLNKSVRYTFGFCRSGQGVNIAANKIKGIRAALIYDTYTAEHAVRHNAANFFSIPARVDDFTSILDTILEFEFEGGRHQLRLSKIGD